MKIIQTKLQTKLFLTNLTVACLVLFSFAAFFYFFVSGQLIDNQLRSMETLNNRFQEQVDASIRGLDNVSVNINYSNISKHILNSSFDLDISDAMLEDTADLFLSISGTELKADQVNLYDFSGNVLKAGLSTMVTKADPRCEDYLSRARQLGGSKIITLPYETDGYSKSAKYKQWFVSLYRSFNNQYGRPVGVIETVKQAKSIFKSLISYSKKEKDGGARTYLFSENGELVYPYDVSPEDAEKISRYFRIARSPDTAEAFDSPLNGEKEYSAVKYSKYSGYTYLTVQTAAVILAPVNRLLKILIGVVAGLLLFSTCLSYRISRSVVKPVKHLKHIIQRLELSTLGQESTSGYPVSVDELDELYQAFQIMNDNLKTSMNQLMEAKEQEMKSRALALQTQINPHFYYNTLSSIMVLAENGDMDVVIKMCRNLSNIMRYITNTANTTVTLREEMDYVQKYLYCMKVRYQTSLNYSIVLDQQLLDKEIPKLIIQPIVENALKYGTNCQPPWYIQIRSSIAPDHWLIDVIDSGEGFTEEALERISESIAQADSNPGMPELKINGLGTLNVYLRWKLFCKDGIIFECGNTEEGHGIVSIGRYEQMDAAQGEKYEIHSNRS